jgi:type III pantothenate kinase
VPVEKCSKGRSGGAGPSAGDGDLLLVMDVGNTQTVLALFQGEAIVHSWRLSTARHRTLDEWGALTQSLFHFNNLSMDQVFGVAISSVVPPSDRPIREFVGRYFGREPFIVGPGIKTGVPILYDHPSEVGADRIVNAVAVIQKYGAPAIVVDFGTATTFDLLNGEGAYVGGLIAPGLGISSEALFDRAAKLPKVEIQRPQRVIGRTTVSSMQSGLYWGYAGLVEGILGRMREEFGPVGLIPATGGLAAVIARDCPSITHVDENLTLEGLRILYERNS